MKMAQGTRYIFRRDRSSRIQTQDIMPDYTWKAALILTLTLVFLFICIITVQALSEETQMYVCVDAESFLRVRSEAGVNYEIIARLYRGDSVTIIDIKGEWAKVTPVGEAGEGWVMHKFLLDRIPTEAEESEPQQGVIKASGRVRLRKTPDGASVKWLQPGTKITVYRYIDSVSGRWAEVNGGYVLAEFIQLQ